MSEAAAITIDSSGRLVVPKAIREQAGLKPGVALEIRYRDGRVEIEPAPRRVRIVQQGKVCVAVPLEPSEPLTKSVVREALEAARNRHAQS